MLQKLKRGCHPPAVRTSLGRRLRESLRAFAAVFANEDLRRLELAWSASVLGQWGYEVALAVFAYRAGGAAAVGVVALIRLLPAAIVAPFAALLGDRFRRKRIMVAADLVRVCSMGGAAAACCLAVRRCGASDWARPPSGSSARRSASARSPARSPCSAGSRPPRSPAHSRWESSSGGFRCSCSARRPACPSHSSASESSG